MAVLYSFWRSSCSWRVRIALELKNIDYEIKTVDIMNKAQHSEEYVRMNPMQKVPALCIDGHTIAESYNIIQYLDDTRPQSPLLPKDAVQRSKVREICEMIQSGIQPLQNVGLLRLLPCDQPDKLKFAQENIRRGFRALEKKLSVTSGKYTVGDNMSMADCFVLPQIYNARKFEVGLDSYPTILRLENSLRDLPAFVKTHPSNQPDTPPEFKNKL